MSIQSEFSYPYSSTKELRRSKSEETSSIRSLNTHIFPLNDVTFLYDLITNIESKPIEKGIYKEVESRVVDKIYEKCKKRNSKTLQQRLTKATSHELSLVLKKLIKNRQPLLFPANIFDDLTNSIGTMESQLLHIKILTEIRKLPQKDIIVKLFNHFHFIIKNSPDPVSLHYEISKYWLNVFCDNLEDNLKMKSDCISEILDAFAPEVFDDSYDKDDDVELEESNENIIPGGANVDCKRSLEMICCNTNNRESTYEYVKNTC